MSTRRVDPDTLASVVRRHLGDDASVADLERLSGGASRETWSFTAIDGSGGRAPLILRRDPPGASGLGTQIDEYRLVAAAEAGGVAVAPLRFALDAGDDLGTGFVMDRVDGETLGKRIVRDDAFAEARRVLARQCGEQLARIHALPLDASGLERARRRQLHHPHPARPAGASRRRLRGHPPGPRARAALAARPRARRGGPGRRPRRLPHREPDRRPRGAAGGARLGAGPRRRPGRGPGLAVRPIVAVRRRRSGGRHRRRGRPARRLPRPRAGDRSTTTPSATGRSSATSAGP